MLVINISSSTLQLCKFIRWNIHTYKDIKIMLFLRKIPWIGETCWMLSKHNYYRYWSNRIKFKFGSFSSIDVKFYLNFLVNFLIVFLLDNCVVDPFIFYRNLTDGNRYKIISALKQFINPHTMTIHQFFLYTKLDYRLPNYWNKLKINMMCICNIHLSYFLMFRNERNIKEQLYNMIE